MPTQTTQDQGSKRGRKQPARSKDVIAATSSHDKTTNGETRYTCQATELLNYSLPLKNWDVRQYVEDYQSKNASLRQLVSVLGPAVLRSLAPPEAADPPRPLALQALAADTRLASFSQSGFIATRRAHSRRSAGPPTRRVRPRQIIRSDSRDGQFQKYASRDVFRR